MKRVAKPKAATVRARKVSSPSVPAVSPRPKGTRKKTGITDTIAFQVPREPRPLPRPCLHARWIAALILLGESNEEIRLKLENDNLACPPDGELALYRAWYAPPPGFTLSDIEHAPTEEFLRQHRLEAIVRGTPDAQQAVRILRLPRARELVEAGAILSVPLAGVADKLPFVMPRPANVDAIQIFLATFFDIAPFTRGQLRLVVEARVSLELEKVGVGADPRSVQRALARDGRVHALSLPRHPASWAVVLMRTGAGTIEQETTAALDQIRNLAITRATEAMLRGGPSDDRRSDGFLRTATRAVELRAQCVSPADVLAAHFSRFALRTEETPVRMVTELAGILPDDVASDVGRGGGAGGGGAHENKAVDHHLPPPQAGP